MDKFKKIIIGLTVTSLLLGIIVIGGNGGIKPNSDPPGSGSTIEEKYHA